MTKQDLLMALEGYPDQAEVYIRTNGDGKVFWWSGLTYTHGDPGVIHLAAQCSTNDADAE